MKRVVKLCVILVFMLPVLIFAQDSNDIHYQPPFLPYLVNVMGMGGAFTASSRGYSSLFYNPAGFAMGDDSLTLISANPYLYTDPISFLSTSTSKEDEYRTSLIEEILSDGYGTGLHAGIGFVKSGLGIGASFIMDSYERGTQSMDDVTGSFHMTLGFIVGYAQMLTLSDMEISIGADIRPMARIYVPVAGEAAAGLLTSFTSEHEDVFELLSAENALHGLGIGFDAGIIARHGAFSYGLSFRDIGGTRFDYRINTFGEVMESLSGSGTLPKDGEKPEGEYIIPMNISAGISYHLDLGPLSHIIDPQFHFDIQDIMYSINQKKNPFLMVHCGMEVELFNMTTLLFGFSQGYFSGGILLHPLFFEMNIAFFIEEKGNNPGEAPSDCFLTEIVVRLKL